MPRDATAILVVVLLYLFYSRNNSKNGTESGYNLQINRLSKSDLETRYEVFLLGANESHTFSRYEIKLMSYDPKANFIFKGDSKSGLLSPADDSSKYDVDANAIVEAKDELISKVKILLLAPANFGCVSIQAKVYHPSMGWIENHEDLSKIVCSSETEPQNINDDSHFERDETHLQTPTHDYCYNNGNCDEFSDQNFDTNYHEHDKNEEKSVDVHSEL